MQHFLKAPVGATRTQVIATKFFVQFLVAAHDAEPTLYLCL